MIKSISMKNCATYDSKGIIIDRCDKINLLYGANGSGKSTISRFLQDTDNPTYNHCSIEKDTDNCDIIVYNKEFKEKNINTNLIPGVLTIGSENIEIETTIEKLTKENIQLENNKTNILSEKERHSKTQKYSNTDFTEYIWDNIFKKYENTALSFVFTGYKGNKTKLKDHIVDIYTHNKTLEHSTSIDDLINKAKLLSGIQNEPLNNINPINDSLLAQIDDIENDDIWKQAIIGNNNTSVGKLIQKLDNSDWVNAGMDYIEEDSDICPFCQQKTLNHELKKELASFFSQEYSNNINYVKKLKNEYEVLTDTLISHIEDIVDNLNTNTYESISNKITQAECDVLHTLTRENILHINNKIQKPSNVISLSSTNNSIESLIDRMNECRREISEYNKILQNKESEKKNLINNTWISFALSERKEIEKYINTQKNECKEIKALDDRITETNQQISYNNKEISLLESNKTSIKPIADYINKTLKSFDFTGFELRPAKGHEDKYEICRPDGSLVGHTLSEGEETFISFLYFKYLLTGTSVYTKMENNKIIVIDDPICSLDSNVLFIISSLIKSVFHKMKEETSKIKQIFVMTHNVYFFKEISFKVRNCSFYILKKNNNISNITKYNSNPIKSSYELLWAELNRNDSSNSIVIQNVMRRILEYYFKFLGNKDDEAVINSFDEEEERIVCRSLYQWINDGSHSLNDELFITGNEINIDVYKKVFKEIFEKTNNIEHYNMMMAATNNKEQK